MAPDLQKKVDQARAARLAREAAMKKQVDAQVGAYIIVKNWGPFGVFVYWVTLLRLILSSLFSVDGC
jgi:hypothetical protein